MCTLRRTIRISCQLELRIPLSFFLTNLHAVHDTQTEIYGDFVFFYQTFCFLSESDKGRRAQPRF